LAIGFKEEKEFLKDCQEAVSNVVSSMAKFYDTWDQNIIIESDMKKFESHAKLLLAIIYTTKVQFDGCEATYESFKTYFNDMVYKLEEVQHNKLIAEMFYLIKGNYENVMIPYNQIRGSLKNSEFSRVGDDYGKFIKFVLAPFFKN
jgi:hypothetical protein